LRAALRDEFADIEKSADGDTIVSSDEAYEGVAPRLDLKARREE
jgi:hypothetical protein